MRYLATFIILITVQTAAWADPVWPKMREFELSVGVKLNNHRNDIDIKLYDVDNNIRHRLICKGDDREEDESVSSKESREQINFYVTWWPMTCILTAGPGPEQGEYTDDTLLTVDYDISGPYQTRGYIGGYDLVGVCGDYPEYGRVRHFRLRGFELTFEFKDVVLEPGTPTPTPAQPFVSPVAYTVMHISLRRDSTAQTANVAPSGYLHPRPPGRCEHVRRGIERSRCRNPDTFAVEECIPGMAYEPWPREINPYAVGTTKQVSGIKPLWRKGGAEMSLSEWRRSALEERVGLIRQAAQERDGEILRVLLPEPPFLLLCGKPGTPEWGGIHVDDIAAWDRLWLAMLADESFGGFENLTTDEVQISSNLGFWIRKGTFRFQDGITVATELSCSALKRVLD